jgi:transcriptional regulator with XRE-family HTH domain
MPKSVFSGAHASLVAVLVDARKRSGLTQVQLALKLRKHQSYVSLVERSQRRVDVLEFVAIARALGADPVELFTSVVEALPKAFPI